MIRLILVLLAACSTKALAHSPSLADWDNHSGQHKPFENPSNEVDYVIVGAGPAGFVLAEQLSQDPGINVVLLEAGPDGTHAKSINVPAYAPFNQNSQYAWNYSSTPQPTLNGAAPALAQGHCLGGGSAINYIAYCRGAPSVYDEWADLSGDEELRWESLFQNDFKQNVRYEAVVSDFQQYVNESAYGDGPLIVSHTKSLSGFDPAYQYALRANLNLTEVDMNAGHGIGATWGVQSIRPSNSTRDYALEAYGWQMAGRQNARIEHGVWVTRIGFVGKRATSVTYVLATDNSTHVLNAKEVIVSAGAIGSPKLLMLSGVGPKAHLEALDIPVVADIPDIGSNLYDHHFSVIEVEVVPSVNTTAKIFDNATFLAETMLQYEDSATGAFTIPDSGSFATARVPNDVLLAANDTFHLTLPADRPHLLFQYSTGPFVTDPAPANRSLISAFVALVQPEASGYIRLNGSDYRTNPLIHSNYYGSPGDLNAILWGYKKLRSILQSSIMAPLIVDEVFPGKNITTDEELLAALKYSATTFHHPVGSVSLGKVLGKDFRVKGLEGIRVVDSSAIPVEVTCHLQANVYALAHRAARAIKQDRYGRES